MINWLKLDTVLPENPKILAAGPLADWLYIAGLCYSARNLADGTIPKAVVARLADLPDPFAEAARLTESGLWVDRGETFEIHDYLAHQTSKERVEMVRDGARVRKARERAKGRRNGLSR